jgi:very-short-patch-repair endonuclease
MARAQPVDPRLLRFARAMRADATDAERLIWMLIRNRRLAGAKFRRQHPFGPYIVDFVCVEARLAIEIDGGQHWADAQQRRDARRTAFLEERGVCVLRFTNREVLVETEGVLEAIWRSIVERSEPSP